MEKLDMDDVDVAMLSTALIAVVVAMTMGKDGLSVILAISTGIFALARGRKTGQRKGGL